LTLRPGERIDYTVTYLEMRAPHGPPPAMPMGPILALIKADHPPVDYFLYLYGTVGRDHEWTDWFAESFESQAAFVHDPKVELYTLLVDGWPGGFFVLDLRQPGVCDLAYFGLVPEATGRGLGPWLLGTAIEMAWERPGVERMTVNTCTLDHPAALPLYQKMGFEPVRQEHHSRILTRARD